MKYYFTEARNDKAALYTHFCKSHKTFLQNNLKIQDCFEIIFLQQPVT